ncbi:MAG: trypsin-like peptidase domain-containing protein [Thermodesulfobacteriota bacterium]
MFCKHCGKEVKVGNKFCNYCGQSISSEVSTGLNERRSNETWKILLVSVVIVAIGIYALTHLGNNTYEDDYTSSFLDELNPYIQPVGYFDDPNLFDSENISKEEWFSHLIYHETGNVTFASTESRFQFPNQREIFSSVVKVVCEDSGYFYYGSGTNFDSAGYVLTNRHVVEGADGGCVIGFPDPESGLIKEAYWATPIIDKDNITGHDLAYLSIEEPVFDEDNNVYGYYQKLYDGLFPYFEITEDCFNTPIQLGDKLFVVGYPPLSGGALTITDGLISSLYSRDGYIITSAKIVSGNSGGLAVDGQGCYVGVPTAVYYEEGDEYLGEVIDAEFVDEFDEAIRDDIDEYLSSQ